MTVSLLRCARVCGRGAGGRWVGGSSPSRLCTHTQSRTYVIERVCSCTLQSVSGIKKTHGTNLLADFLTLVRGKSPSWATMFDRATDAVLALAP
eukprot:1292297-Prymnesium_polylepis.1